MTAQIHPISSAEPQPQRDANGKFLPGFGGRPKGSKNRISSETLTAVRNMGPDAIQQLWQLVMAGDFKAIEYVLDKILPKGRTVELDDAEPATIADALANGELAPDEARSIATAILRLNEAGELAAIKQRLEELEKLVNDGNAGR